MKRSGPPQRKKAMKRTAMKRGSGPKSDPTKAQEWKQRQKPMKRTAMKASRPKPKRTPEQRVAYHAELDKVRERDMGRCQIRFAGICLHAAEWGHHIVPQRNGGPDSAENLILACWPCNVRVEEIGKIDATATGLFAESVDDLPAAADARARYLRGYTRGGRPWETGAPDQSKPEPYW